MIYFYAFMLVAALFNMAWDLTPLHGGVQFNLALASALAAFGALCVIILELKN